MVPPSPEIPEILLRAWQAYGDWRGLIGAGVVGRRPATVHPMKIVRRALFALWVAGVIAGAMRVRGRGGVPPQHGGWQPIDVGEG